MDAKSVVRRVIQIVIDVLNIEAAQHCFLHRLNNSYGIPVNNVVNLGHSEAKSAFKMYRKKDGVGNEETTMIIEIS